MHDTCLDVNLSVKTFPLRHLDTVLDTDGIDEVLMFEPS